MGKKLWYNINVKCIKLHLLSDLQVDEVNNVARVKSKGLAILVAKQLESVYNSEYFKITID